jgi:hypothetical protein
MALRHRHISQPHPAAFYLTEPSILHQPLPWVPHPPATTARQPCDGPLGRHRGVLQSGHHRRRFHQYPIHPSAWNADCVGELRTFSFPQFLLSKTNANVFVCRVQQQFSPSTQSNPPSPNRATLSSGKSSLPSRASSSTTSFPSPHTSLPSAGSGPR